MKPETWTTRLLPLPVLAVMAGCHVDLEDRVPLVRSRLRADIVGCYTLYHQDGRLLDSTFYNASPRVRLDSLPIGITARDTFPGIYWRAERLDSLGQPLDPGLSDLAGPSWSADSLTDSIDVSFSNGFSGALLIFDVPANRSHDTLFGRVEEHWDFASPTSRGAVKAVSIACVL